MQDSKASEIMRQRREWRQLQDAEITDFLQKNGMIGTYDRIDTFMEMVCNNPLCSYNSTCSIISWSYSQTLRGFLNLS